MLFLRSKLLRNGVGVCVGAFLCASFCLYSTDAFAFTCHQATCGKASFEISKRPALTVEGKVYRAPLIIKNGYDAPIVVEARLSSIESVYLFDESDASNPVEIAPPSELARTFTIPANSELNETVAFAVRNAYWDAHYPIRAKFSFTVDGKKEETELRPVFATKLVEFLEKSRETQTLVLKEDSYLKFTKNNETNYTPYWRRLDDEQITLLPPGWTGGEAESKASLSLTTITRDGSSRSAWAIHPPYAGGPGVFGLRFDVELPVADKLELRFFRAMRDVQPPEPPTDGARYRVYAQVAADENAVKEALKTKPADGTKVFEEQYDGVKWREAKIDLSSFSGKRVVLTFEADPGAKRDTTCDLSFWGDVALAANPQEKPIMTAAERQALSERNVDAFEKFVASAPKDVPTSGLSLGADSFGFDLDGGQYAVATFGKYGVCDGFVTIGSAEKRVQINGVRARYQGVDVGFESSFAPCEVFAQPVEATELEKNARLFALRRNDPIIGDLPNDANFDLDELAKSVSDSDLTTQNALACFISKTQGGLAFRFVASHNAEIESLQFGSFSEKAARAYFGHGYCVVDPKAFTQSGDGFGCSTSCVGFDFVNGLSIVEATTRPVEEFVVNPDLRVYTLTTSPDSRLTLRSGESGAFACAIDYAPGFDKNPAPLVPKKAGRFVFDYWGGSYASVLERMKDFVAYGMNDSLLIQHVWQRYGYDVRLPDVWPPRTEQGTLDELKETQAFCDANDIPFGLHDNYIDFYPDADGFTYDDIIINPDGQPQKAWYNPGPDVQSYRFKPTAIFPYAERNLKLIRQDLMQTAYFTDVFSSIHMTNFYDREGRFHSRAETVDAWNRYFNLVRDSFNGNAITISESGNDALIGSLDGADAILRRVTSAQENYSTVFESADVEYAPWADAVNHKRFILHGVGYSDRYQGGLSRALRGIESDDYLSSEALTGHAVMADLGMSIRETVRKYWLMQNLARSLALDEIVGVEFVDGDIHRQKIAWKSGVVVYVNRGVDDWTIALEDSPALPCKNVVLPRFGFWTVDADARSFGGIVRLDGQVVELRVDGENFFVNGRVKIAHPATPIRPSFEDVEILDGSSLSGKLVFEAFAPTDKPYAPFLHLERPKTWWADKPELNVLPLSAPNKPTDQWQGREEKLFGDKITVRVPDELQPGLYELLCGIYEPSKGGRLTLLGNATTDSRYRLGSIIVEGRGEKRSISFKPTPPLYDADLRLIPNKKATDFFGLCQTVGAFRYEQKSENVATLTPLPNDPAFEVALANSFVKDGAKYEIVARDREGSELKRAEIQAQNGRLVFTLDAAKAFSYDVVKR